VIQQLPEKEVKFDVEFPMLSGLIHCPPVPWTEPLIDGALIQFSEMRPISKSFFLLLASGGKCL
jgi:hypothetical protein